jgi:hypothetical protein
LRKTIPLAIGVLAEKRFVNVIKQSLAALTFEFLLASATQCLRSVSGEAIALADANTVASKITFSF